MSTPLPLPARLAFLLHALVELPAALTFLLAPRRQLPRADAEAVLVLQNFGGLLAATVGVALALACRSGVYESDYGYDYDRTAAVAALALGSYHWWPCRRAYVRMRDGIDMRGPQARALGGPPVHLFVHAVCLVALVGTGLWGIVAGR